MKFIFTSITILAIMAFTSSAAHAQIGGRGSFLRDDTAEKSPHFTWITHYDEALAEAKRSGKPILLTFRCVP